MHTAQNYVGKNSHANSVEQTDQKATPAAATTQSATHADAQPAKLSPFFSPTEDQAQKLIQSRYRDLHQVVDKFMLESSAASNIERIRESWTGWSLYHFGEGDAQESITVKREMLDEVYSLMGLMTFLAKLGDSWRAIEQLEERHNYSNQDQL